MPYPENFRYTKDHHWAEARGDSVTIGITDYAQRQLGDIVFVELPAPGARLAQGAEMAIIESVKTANEILAPLSGEVIETNTALLESPEIVNRDPHGAGWLIKSRLSAPGQLQGLLSASEYEADRTSVV